MKTTAKDFFLYLGIIIGLYTNAVNFLILTFQIIERTFPLAGEYIDPTGSDMIVGIAILIIFFPAFIYLAYLVNKDLKLNPGKKEMWIRRWMIFLTLFAAGLAVAIDLVVLIQRFLGAEDLTLRFFLKVIFVLSVAISAFKYYLYDLKRNINEYKKSAKIFVYIVSLIVLSAIIYGIIIIGSPSQRRAAALDQTRINDLMNIQYQIVYQKWENKGVVPAKIDELNDPINGFTLPLDPETKQNYEYKKLGKNRFELCAVFKTEASTTASNIALQTYPVTYPTEAVNENWQHSIGRVCFDRTIDPNLYKIQPGVVQKI